MRNIQVANLKGPAPAAHSDQTRRAARWRTIGYVVAVGAFLFMVTLAWLRPDPNRTEILDWRPVLTLADAAWEKGDLYAARHLYLEVDQIASSQQDWEGLVAAACGIQRLEGAGPYSKTFAILVRATMAAESRQSRAGIAAVAGVLVAAGEEKVASMVASRIRPHWPEELLDSSSIAALGCQEFDTGAT